MRVFITGVGGQLGHDSVNEIIKRGYNVLGSDIQSIYLGIQDSSTVTKSPYVQLNITNQLAVMDTIQSVHPDAIIHCAAWTTVDAA